MNASLKDDLSTLTTIKDSTLSKLTKEINYCITDAVCKSIYNEETETNIDIGIGTLTIRFDNNQVRYRFVPSKELEASIASAIIEEKNVLVTALETSLVDKLNNIYKSFF